MNRTERRIETPTRYAGIFATLRPHLCGRGRGASVVPRRLVLGVVGVVLTAALTVPGAASAHFTRPFLRVLTENSGSSLLAGGLATDSEKNVWVGRTTEGKAPYKLEAFGPSGVFLKTLTIESPPMPPFVPTPPRSLALDTSGNLYVGDGETTASVEVFDSTGTFLRRFASFGKGAIAVDDSAEPSAGTVYVDHGSTNPKSPYGDELVPGVEKFNSAGKPVNFSATSPYISGNEIHGTPSGSWEQIGPIEFWSKPAAVAVDSRGHIFSVDRAVVGGGPVVDEYAPSGLFVRTYMGEETPGLEGSHGENGFGGNVNAVAVDPVSGHLLVAVSESHSEAGKTRFAGAIDEFDVATGQFVAQILTTSPGDQIERPEELATASDGTIYLYDEVAGAVSVFGPGRFLPSFKTAATTEAKAASIVLNGFVNPEGLSLSDCHFEYVTEAAFKATGFADLVSGGQAPCVPGAGSITPDFSYHAVHAELNEHLQAGTVYQYRLSAKTSGPLGGTDTTSSLAFTVPDVPRVDGTAATNLSSTFADLNAEIDPLGADTTYQFQYLPQTAYEANGDSFSGPDAPLTAPVAPADIQTGGPDGSVDAKVLQHIGGLQPGTTYRFRVVATNEVGTVAGENSGGSEVQHSFTTLPQVSTGLPDDRAYELLTPPSKGDAEDMFAPGEEQHDTFAQVDYGTPAESGNGFILRTFAAFGNAPASGENGYVFTRDANGWAYRPLAEAGLGVQSVSSDVSTPDFSMVGIEDQVGSVSNPAGAAQSTLVGPPGGPYTTLHEDPPAGHEGEGENTHIVGASHDLAHIVFESLDHTLAPGAESEHGDVLYEAAGGKLTLLNVNSEGEPVSKCGAILGQSKIPGTSHNAVSASGSQVVFTAPDPYAKNQEGAGGCWNGAEVHPPELYVRSGTATTEISAPEEAAPEFAAHHPATYVGASEDGSRVFFVSRGELTADDAGFHDAELYEYNTDTRKLTRISAGEMGDAAAVFTVPAVSTDGTAVYFTAAGRLTANAPVSISENAANLYRYDTGTRATIFIATISRNDYPTTSLSGWAERPENPWQALIPSANWYTTPDGRYLLFATKQELTGYSTVEAAPHDCPEPNGNPPDGHCQEVYRYDSATGSIACLSCDPSGAPPTSNASFAESAKNSIQWGAGPVRAMSNNGSYAFFDTGDALVPQDENNTDDVYEWHEGTISLISSGTDLSPSFFLGASPDGANVFFGTHARLVPADTDSAGDLYDARICTETDPCIKAAAGETAQCEGDTCQSTPPMPTYATPGSSTFFSVGNLVSAVGSSPPSEKKTAAQIRAEALAKALKTCRKKPKRRRAACERQARIKYAPAKKKGSR